jgi:hypothetical protein
MSLARCGYQNRRVRMNAYRVQAVHAIRFRQHTVVSMGTHVAMRGENQLKCHRIIDQQPEGTQSEFRKNPHSYIHTIIHSVHILLCVIPSILISGEQVAAPRIEVKPHALIRPKVSMDPFKAQHKNKHRYKHRINTV